VRTLRDHLALAHAEVLAHHDHLLRDLHGFAIGASRGR
jgi:hypothetical protein